MAGAARARVARESEVSAVLCMAGIAPRLDRMTGSASLTAHLRRLGKGHGAVRADQRDSRARFMAEFAALFLLLLGDCLVLGAAASGLEAVGMPALPVAGECCLVAFAAAFCSDHGLSRMAGIDIAAVAIGAPHLFLSVGALLPIRHDARRLLLMAIQTGVGGR